MTSSSRFKDLSEFLAKHNAKNENGNVGLTHTRIPSKELNIYGGSYIIPKEELKTFWKLYHAHVFINNKKEYLTEKQLEIGPILVDFDFRYDYNVSTRRHTKEHIQDIIILYLEVLKEILKFVVNKPFDIYVMEKPNPVEYRGKIKDGIHAIWPNLVVPHSFQHLVRKYILDDDNPLQNRAAIQRSAESDRAYQKRMKKNQKERERYRKKQEKKKNQIIDEDEYNGGDEN
jgi:hypothetical protein